ncbi:recombinase family protein [Herbivorax sp. ANBcel31]|uniref:recombinase family protein n=1 Tax=Herbivorax sp. ANBcel31 TaxID=3069754 RepID=UPI0027B34851|nr:recombinase family protein [Herbivorax sp. ANBcel31]MDQ2088076.1 recombinase family protein [Herbivorax sp. ANBcel31]
MVKVAIYCRLSDEDKNKSIPTSDSESIQNQKNMLTKYSLDQGWSIYKIYSDDDFSGLDSDRPEWNNMIQEAQEKKFNIILCKSQARFTRDMEVVEKYFHNKFIEWGIRFIGLADSSDTLNKGNKKQRQINGLVNEWYCEDVSENIKSVFDVKRNEGKFIGSFACYGYKKDPENKNNLLIDDETAQVIKMIFEWYLEGYGTQHIAYMLNEKRIFNPTKYKQNVGLNFKNSSAKNNFGLWNKTTVKRILKNEMYIGNMIQGKRKKVSYKSKKIISTPQEEWIRIENTHEPIISKETFNEVQRRISSRQRSTGKGQAHIFSTKVKCLDCGSTMNKVTTFRGNKRYIYLRCKTYSLGNKNLCTSHSIRLDELEEIITERIIKYINSYLDENSIINKLKSESNLNNKFEKMKNEISSIMQKIDQNSLILKNLYIDKVKANITNEQFIELNNSFLDEKNQLLKRKEELNKNINEFIENSKNINKWSEIVKKYKGFKQINHIIVNEFIDYIEIGEKNKDSGQKIKLHWLF